MKLITSAWTVYTKIIEDRTLLLMIILCRLYPDFLKTIRYF